MIPFLHGVFATNGGVASDFELIETQTVGAGGVSSVTFSNIPSTYKHLQIRGMWTVAVFPSIWLTARFNSDGGSNYAIHSLLGDGTSASAGALTSQTYMNTGHGSSIGNPCPFIMDILDYASTSKYKTIRVLFGSDANGSGRVGVNSDLWMSSSAISSITLMDINGNSIIGANSRFDLYGIKG